MSFRKAAIALIERGLWVFPLPPGGTVPDIPFSTESSGDIKKITKWWRSDKSKRNIGVHTGGGLVVVDEDVQHGGNIDDLPIALPATFTIRTPSGGRHFYFACPADIRNSVSKVSPGIDIRGHNGFVVAPGSYREEHTKADGTVKKGGYYDIIYDVPIAPLPDWLEELCLTESDAPTAASGKSIDEPLLDVPAGERNDRLFKEAAGLRGKGWPLEAIETAILARNESFTQPLTAKEVNLIARQASKYQPNTTSTYDEQLAALMPQKHPDEAKADKPKTLPFATFESDELYEKDIPPLNYCIEPLMAEGLYLLTGRPKGGKSWLSMELAASVATGELLWGEFTPNQGNVLYMALEDGERRLKSRLSHFENPKGITFVLDDVAAIDDGLIQQLDWWHQAAPKPQLVIIDIFQRIRNANDTKDNAYAFDYNSVKPLQSWAITKHVCICLVHHTRKATTEFDTDSVSGSHGLAGAVDGLMFLKTPNNGHTARLSLQARDTDNGDYDLIRCNKPNGRWEFGGEVAELDEGPTVEARIVACLQADGASTVKELAKCTQSARDYLSVKLNAMLEEGILQRDESQKAHVWSLAKPV